MDNSRIENTKKDHLRISFKSGNKRKILFCSFKNFQIKGPYYLLTVLNLFFSNESIKLEFY